MKELRIDARHPNNQVLVQEGVVEKDEVFMEIDEGSHHSRSSTFIGKTEAIQLGRFLLNLFGAPLEEPKPEPKVGQVWRHRGEGWRGIIVYRFENAIDILDKNGQRWELDIKDFLLRHDFVTENWATEEKE